MKLSITPPEGKTQGAASRLKSHLLGQKRSELKPGVLFWMGRLMHMLPPPMKGVIAGAYALHHKQHIDKSVLMESDTNDRRQ